ncbi:MAG: glutamine-hydrolyzing carbamoyl-phosphate synthase small subunit [Bacteroidaceae bacterium]|nr:glutamine-hydrolyzing carbamoyl-phosphate synthase small subunit [Bacteroidaceae bacterium]
MKQAALILEDGSIYTGWSFGYDCDAVGEVVFNTAMTGYPESLTDPSYAGQVLVMTSPLIGNYGVPPLNAADDYGIPRYIESSRIHVKALIVADYSTLFSHWNSRQSLSDWLKAEKVPALTGIDTRRLTIRLRERGVMMGRISLTSQPSNLNAEGIASSSSADCGAGADHKELRERSGNPQTSYGSVNWVERVSCKDIITYPAAGGAKRVVLLDCGVKANILRSLLLRGLEVVRVPWNYDFNALDFDGLFLSNGPGDPERCDMAVENIRRFLHEGSVRPCMGICLGNQLLARAAGARTYKLKYGHRGHNQPVRMVGTDRCFITSQNHGYAVDESSLPDGWEPLFVNMNDGSNEGLRHKEHPWLSAQFHPEACPGPEDTAFLFDRFAEMMNTQN